MRHFFYGTLLDPDVRNRVLGLAARAEGRPARLDGYRRVHAPGKGYPVVIPGSGSVAGLLFDGVTPRQRLRIAAFEGTGYRKVLMTVTVVDGQALTAWAFLPLRPPQFAAEWSLQRWRKFEKVRLLRLLDARGPAVRARSSRSAG